MEFLNIDFLINDELHLVLKKTMEGNPQRNWVPAYYFDIVLNSGEIIGGCDLRVGHNEMIYYCGNIGYHIDEEYRGHHYAAQATTLLFELARKHDMNYLLLTCNPDNIASIRTCELVGCQLIETVELPIDSYLRDRGDTEKCIYKYNLE